MARQAAAGGRYRVLVGLNYPTDPDVLRRILAGAHVPDHARQARRAEPGDVVDDIPEVSIAACLASGYIERADGAPLTPKRRETRIVTPAEPDDVVDDGGALASALFADDDAGEGE